MGEVAVFILGAVWLVAVTAGILWAADVRAAWRDGQTPERFDDDQ